MPNLCQLYAASPALSLKGRLGLAEVDDADDMVLTQLIGWVGERFERECHRQFDRQASVTEEFDADSMEICPSRYPIESVSAWHLKDNEDDGWVAQTGVDYIIKAASNGVKCILWLSSPLGSTFQRGRVTYTGGYVLPGTTPDSGQTALPTAIEAAAIEQCAHWYQRRHQLGLANVSGQGGSISMSVVNQLDLLPQVMNTLRLFRRVSAL